MLDNIIEAKVKDYNDVRKLVEEDYKNIQITSKYDVIFEEVSNILFEYPDSLNRAEEFLSINKKNTGLMTLSKIKKKFKILNNEETNTYIL